MSGTCQDILFCNTRQNWLTSPFTMLGKEVWGIKGNITFNGSSTNRNYFATFTSGGTFTQNGRSKFYGSIASVGSLTFNGRLEIDSGFSYVNRDLLSEGDEYLATSSRR
jgi:hypothetical protein